MIFLLVLVNLKIFSQLTILRFHFFLFKNLRLIKVANNSDGCVVAEQSYFLIKKMCCATNHGQTTKLRHSALLQAIAVSKGWKMRRNAQK